MFHFRSIRNSYELSANLSMNLQDLCGIGTDQLCKDATKDATKSEAATMESKMIDSLSVC